MTDRFDAIVIGAGHNGLVCAGLLAKAGKSVLVLEAADKVGGAAVTREFADGFSVSACAHLLYQLQPEVVRDLKLKLDLAGDSLQTVALGENGEHLRLSYDKVDGVDPHEAEAYQQFSQRMRRYSDLLRRYLNRTPPRLGTRRRRDLMTLARLGLDVRMLGRDDMREFLRLIGMNIHDELEERFTSPLLKGAISLDAVLGTHLGPRSPTTMLTYLYRLAGDHGCVSLPRGGMGSVTEALASAAKDAGAAILTDMPVDRIVVRNGRVIGVEAGERFESMTVISNADIKRTVFDLLGARHVETGFARRVENVRARGNAAKLNLALDGLPDAPGLSEGDLSQRIVIAPDEHYVERAFNPAKYGETSPEPVMEVTLPSIRDASLAPEGKHVLSAVIQYAPYELKNGWTPTTREAFADTVFATLEKYLPGIQSCMIKGELLTPADIENEFGITGGHWHHAELSFDQFMFTRPVAGAAQYRLPIDGLYLCGAGAHPGGGVSGAAGRNAAREILNRERSR